MKNLWKDNKIQFARLIAELEGIGIFNNRKILKQLKEVTNLETESIFELVERAQKIFEQANRKYIPYSTN